MTVDKMIESKQYIKGADLTQKQAETVKASMIHRDTVEHPYNADARVLLNTVGLETPTDAEWIAARAFRFYPNGELAGCLPVSVVK